MNEHTLFTVKRIVTRPWQASGHAEQFENLNYAAACRQLNRLAQGYEHPFYRPMPAEENRMVFLSDGGTQVELMVEAQPAAASPFCFHPGAEFTIWSEGREQRLPVQMVMAKMGKDGPVIQVAYTWQGRPRLTSLALLDCQLRGMKAVQIA